MRRERRRSLQYIHPPSGPALSTNHRRSTSRRTGRSSASRFDDDDDDDDCRRLGDIDRSRRFTRFRRSCSISCAKRRCADRLCADRRYACRPLCSTGGGFVGSFFGGIFGGVFGSFCGSPPLHRVRQAFLLPLMPQLWPPQPPQHKSSPEVGRFSFLRPPPLLLIKIDVRFSVRNRRRLINTVTVYNSCS